MISEISYEDYKLPALLQSKIRLHNGTNWMTINLIIHQLISIISGYIIVIITIASRKYFCVAA